MAITAPALAGDTIFMGAAHICYDPSSTPKKYCWCEGPVTVQLRRTELDTAVSGFGTVVRPATDEVVEVTFTPANRCDAGLLSWMYGNLFSAKPGASRFGGTDHPLWVHTMDGRVLKIANCLPTSVPGINFGVDVKRWNGQVTCTGIVKRNTSRTTAGALFSPWETLAWSLSPDEDDFPQSICEVRWAGIGGGDTVLHSLNGWSLSVSAALRPLTVSNLGTVDYRIDDVTVEVSAVPVNASESDLWGTYALGGSRALGTSVAGGEMTITEDFPGVCCTLPNMVWTERPTRFDPQNPLAGECRWTARRVFDGSGWSSVASLSMAAAPDDED